VTGASVATATDVYALDVLLYVLLTGEHPAGSGFRSVAQRVVGNPQVIPEPFSAYSRPSLEEINGDLPEEDF
jgi:hypothetical protein